MPLLASNQSVSQKTNSSPFPCEIPGDSVGDVKFKIADEILGISSAIDIMDRKLAS